MRTAIVIAASVLAASVSFGARILPPRNVILMIGDGMGLPQVQLAESFLGAQTGAFRVPLRMTSLPVAGLSRTHSANCYVTDSAAGGTALSCGQWTANGALGVDRSNTCRLVSLAELARQHGRKVGIATTDLLVGATPAAFYAHQGARSAEYAIGADLLRSGFDLFVAGAGFGDPKGTTIGTNDLVHLTNALAPFVASAVESTNGLAVAWKPLMALTAVYGYAWIESADAFTVLRPSSQKTIAVVDVPRAICAASNDISLADITRKCIELLDSSNGFFLMVEAAHIDKMCHANDAAAAMREVLAFDRAVAVAFDFCTNRPDDTLLVITADHETGGMTLGHGEHRFDLLACQRDTVGCFYERFDSYRMAHTMRPALSRLYASLFFLDDAGKKRALFDDIKPLLLASFGLGSQADGLGLSPQEWCRLEQAFGDSFRNCDDIAKDDPYWRLYDGQDPLAIVALRMLDEKAGVRFSTFGHSGAAVPVFACGAESSAFCGVMDNTDIARRIMKIMFPTVPFPLATPPCALIRPSCVIGEY